MGNCGKTPQTEHFQETEEIQLELVTPPKPKENTAKLLLLGPGDSGKSTIFRQMKIIHHNGYTEEERETFIETINENILESMKAIVNALPRLSLEISDENQENVDLIRSTLILTKEVEDAIVELWKDPVIQKAYSIITDVGGQRNERKKWVRCFQGVTALIFCSSLSEYDQNLFEDENQKRIPESLMLFEEVCNSRWFVDTSVILFLNKVDIFRDKISKTDLSVCFPEYKDGHDFDKAIAFIEQKFKSLNQNPERKQIYTHTICATDTEEMRFVFDSIKAVIQNERL
ncbi:guanine nucleotide-binding protein g(o) subunit alpha [Anaeramoeba ignava]|uniref:Guanine nucleotide-binding protein g(O) subunit alpha n=1 Tax=Anaeramoeba ignava TaxID=1746090 RepID=A0A9Q0LQ19_ANAIG|nr:guanine nucleotide-binding protein g(o) subunit alpha [Anaeramoeba ignava]